MTPQPIKDRDKILKKFKSWCDKHDVSFLDIVNAMLDTDGFLFISPREAAMLYEQMSHDWLDRRFYEELSALLKRLRSASEGVKL